MLMYRFMIPDGVDRFGLVTHRECAVSVDLIPLMAKIIEAATKPARVEQTYAMPDHGLQHADNAMWEHLVSRVRYDLEHALHDEAKKTNRCLITRVTHSEHVDDGGVLFRATAVAMPLLDLPEGRTL